MVILVIFTSVIGFYSLPPVSKYIYPQYHGTSMSLLLFNVTCLLALSSAIPLHASLLGLANPSFPPVYYAPLFDSDFCRPASDLCFHSGAAPLSSPVPLSPSSSSSAVSILPPSSLQKSQQPCAISPASTFHQEGAFLLRHQQIALSGITPSHSPTSTLTSPILLRRTGGKLMALSYSAVFLLMCCWFLHKQGRELERMRMQVTSLCHVAVNWWFRIPPLSPVPPSSTNSSPQSSSTSIGVSSAST